MVTYIIVNKNQSPFELYHHGVKGMKWGVRRYQNYDGTRKKTREAQYHYYRKGQNKKFDTEKTKTGMSAFLSAYDNATHVNITDLNKSTVHDFLAASIEDLGEYNKNIQWTPDKIDPMSFEDSIKTSNAGRKHSPDNAYWNNNCVFSSCSLIMRKKGYDTDGGPCSDGVPNEAIGFYFDGAKREEPGYKGLKDAILSHGPNRYGVMSTKLGNGCNHEVTWETDSNNKIHIYDGQTNNKYDSYEEYDEKYGGMKKQGTDKDYTSLYDLTDANPNLNHMAEDHVCIPLIKENETKKGFSVKAPSERDVWFQETYRNNSNNMSPEQRIQKLTERKFKDLFD